MKKKLAILLVGTMIASSILAGCGSKKSEPTKKETSGELKGDITFWHSFTQGPRMEVIQQTADQFMKDNPGVKIKIETFSWGDFYTKWTTGLASGNVPDMSTALPGHVVEMMDADALEPVDDLIDDIGRNKFSKTFKFTDINYAVAGREDKETMKTCFCPPEKSRPAKSLE